MSNRRISLSDIPIGKPLQFDVYATDGALLLRRGHVVNHVHQIEALHERGLFSQVDHSFSDVSGREAPPKSAETPSVLYMVNSIRTDLRTLLYNLPSESHAPEKILAIAARVEQATQTDNNVALASILLNQEGSYGARHAVDSAIIAILLARAVNKSQEELTLLCAAALTMNLSIIRQQEKLQDKTDKLNQAERDLVLQHTTRSVEQLSRVGVRDTNWLAWVAEHHEAEDGSGYPAKKIGLDIADNAKILAVADRYTASICRRKYRKTLLPNAALRDIVAASKTKIDPMLAALLIRELGAYPVGTCVRLADGEIGIVTAKGSNTISPYVHVVIGSRGAPLADPIKRDTSKSVHAVREVLAHEQTTMRVSMRQLWGETASL